jgi:hypothetical protein
MTDWTKQADEMVKSWTGTQQKMWESWLNMMQGMGTNQPGDMWEKAADNWYTSMKSVLEAQVTWSQFLADSVASNAGSNKQLADMSQQVVDMTRRWSETQMQVLNTWVDEVKKNDPSQMKMSPEEIMTKMQSMQEAIRKMIETQMDMVRTMTGPQDKPSK